LLFKRPRHCVESFVRQRLHLLSRWYMKGLLTQASLQCLKKKNVETQCKGGQLNRYHRSIGWVSHFLLCKKGINISFEYRRTWTGPFFFYLLGNTGTLKRSTYLWCAWCSWLRDIMPCSWRPNKIIRYQLFSIVLRSIRCLVVHRSAGGGYGSLSQRPLSLQILYNLVQKALVGQRLFMWMKASVQGFFAGWWHGVLSNSISATF